MRRFIPGRVSPSLLVALAALFIVLGGTSYAATTAPSKPQPLKYTKATLINNWTWGGYETFQPAYGKDSMGVVHLRGSVANGTAQTAAFTLPVADRPTRYLYFPSYTLQSTEGSVEVAPDGSVYAIGTSATKFSSLDGVTFSTK